MTRGILLALAEVLAGCGTSAPPKPLPTCVSLGCGDAGDSLCTRAGRCVCKAEACQREHIPGFDAQLAPDAPAQ